VVVVVIVGFVGIAIVVPDSSPATEAEQPTQAPSGTVSSRIHA